VRVVCNKPFYENRWRRCRKPEKCDKPCRFEMPEVASFYYDGNSYEQDVLND
jgi:hypothetical protein